MRKSLLLLVVLGLVGSGTVVGMTGGKRRRDGDASREERGVKKRRKKDKGREKADERCFMCGCQDAHVYDTSRRKGGSFLTFAMKGAPVCNDCFYDITSEKYRNQRLRPDEETTLNTDFFTPRSPVSPLIEDSPTPSATPSGEQDGDDPCEKFLSLLEGKGQPDMNREATLPVSEDVDKWQITNQYTDQYNRY